MTIASLTNLFLDGAPEAAGWLTAAVQATLLLLVAFGLGRALRRTSAARRHLILTSGLIAAGLLPLAMGAMPWRVPLIPHVPTPALEAPSSRAEAAASQAVGPGLDAVAPGLETVAPGLGMPGSWSAVPERGVAVRATPSQQATPEAGPAGMASAVPFAPGGTGAEARRANPPDDRTGAPGTRVRAGDGAGSASGLGAGSASELGAGSDAAPSLRKLLPILWGLWLLGAAAVLAWITWGTVRLYRIRKRAASADSKVVDGILRRLRKRLGIARPVRILESDEVDVPMAIGLWRPAVLLPRGATETWPRSRLEAVLAHELGHIRRLDVLSHLANRLSCAVHWYNPLAWLASRRARRECERACDDLAIASGTRPSAYARVLLELTGSAARTSGWRTSPAVGLPMARPGDLEGRILAILEDRSDRRPATTRSVLTAILPAVGVVLFLSAATAAPEDLTSPPSRAQAEKDPPAEHASDREATAEDDPDRRESAGEEAGLDQAGPPNLLLETLADLLEDSQPGVRAAAAASLGKRQVGEAVPALIAALEDPVGTVRKRAAGALGRIEDPAAVPSLSERLLEDGDGRVRRAAAWALGEMENPAAVDALETALAAELPSKLRAKVVEALGETEQPAAARILERLLAEAEPDLRRKALEALVENGTPQASEALVAAMRSPDPDLRREAAEALGRHR